MKGRIWWLIAVGVLLMGVGVLGAQAVLAAGLGSTNPSMDLISVKTGAGAAQEAALTLDDIAAIQGAVQGARLSWWANGRGAIGTDARNTQADVYAVSAAFQDFHHMDMLYGSFLPRKDNGMAVVLDSDLAYRIFGTENAVGMEVKFAGKTFQVCGVCRADKSLLGMMSGNGLSRAYLSGYDLVTTGKLTVGGFEAALPAGVPGASLQSVREAMQAQKKAADSFLIEDKSERARLDAEISRLPLVLLAASAALLLLLFFLRTARGIGLEALAVLRGGYFLEVWPRLLWRLCKVLVLLAACVGLAWLMWRGVGLRFTLPAKYIPGSWIDTTFYAGLIRSESQAAIAAQAYTGLWWEWAYGAAVKLSRALDAAALFGAAVAALSLRAIWADRRLAAVRHHASAGEQGVWDAPVLWLLALLSFGAYLLITHMAGLPVRAAPGALAALLLTLGVWTTALHRQALESLFFHIPGRPPGTTLTGSLQRPPRKRRTPAPPRRPAPRTSECRR